MKDQDEKKDKLKATEKASTLHYFLPSNLNQISIIDLYFEAKSEGNLSCQCYIKKD